MDTANRLADFLPYQLSVTSNAVSGRIAQEYRSRFGLSVPEWRVMAVLGDAGAVTQRDLTQLTLMDKVAVNRACKVLEERGLAVRQPNALDGRSHLLQLTQEGETMHGEIMPLAVEMEQRLFTNFSADEIATFRSLLGRVLNEVRDLDAEGLDSGAFGVG
ncbi:MarR family winged helix-turn-helix transcriptional regulator [Altericroceibacterium xinjiangense]|uniref:MarR family winged helix-turn-helix transcriptional regulator n=1 Tax=Altericroceibacterium xinjiangense TaxID=762261 RepID=UPI000F7F9019|nr:MarR family winged helix-turn-helix transcriptional regulator [Altericroceibacterium xinjiangense]